MREALARALGVGPEQANVDRGVDRILAANFYRTGHRPSAPATVIRLHAGGHAGAGARSTR